MNYYSINDDVITFANVNDPNLINMAKELITPEHLVIIYSLEKNVKDLLYNQEYENTFGYLYYYNELGTLVRMRISGDMLSENSKKIELKKHLEINYEKYKETKVKKINNDIEELTVPVLLTTTTCDFGIPKLSLGGTDIHGDYSYIVHEHLVYRCDVGTNYIFRVESKVQFTSGDAAVEPGYNDNYQSNYGIITGELFKHVEYGYGTWYSAQPKKLDYFPKNEPAYRTITSGYDINLTLGRTDSTSVSASETGFGISAGSEFSSSIGLGYFYQETRTVSVPNMNALWLSQTEGAAWEFTSFSHSPDKAVTVYPGMLFETIPATPYAMRYNGEYHVNIHFKTKYDRKYLWDLYQNQYVEEIILLDVMI